ncbi:MAG: TonB family protein [Sulfuricurvum sp.]
MRIPMSTKRKSFILSIIFHSMMGALAFFVVTHMSTPALMLKIPMEKMTLVSLCEHPMSIKPQTSSPQTPKPPLPQEQVPLIQKHIPTTQATPITPTSSTKTLTLPSSIATIETPPRSTPITPPQTAITPAVPPIKAAPKSDLTAEKKSFFALLRTTIQNNLRYPTAARRREIEGDIAVRFSLANDGSIHSISIQRGETIFHNAAKTAIALTSGIDIPKNLSDALPMEIELTLEFRLNS